MSAFLVLMLICFVVIALRSFQEIGAILAGFLPRIPPDLPVPGRDTPRLASSSIIAIVGTAIAPGALLGIPYMSSDAHPGAPDLRGDLRRSVINLGLIFGAYALLIIIAGGFALYTLPDHAEIETVHQAAAVLTAALPAVIAFLGPVIFSLGLFFAALTTLVVTVQVITYLSLDMAGKPWAFTPDNRRFHRLMIGIMLAAAVLAPLWSFPALLKVLLLMGVNILVIPIVLIALIYLVNRRTIMGENTAGAGRNLVLGVCLLVSVILAADKVPDYARTLVAYLG